MFGPLASLMGMGGAAGAAGGAGGMGPLASLMGGGMGQGFGLGQSLPGLASAAGAAGGAGAAQPGVMSTMMGNLQNNPMLMQQVMQMMQGGQGGPGGQGGAQPGMMPMARPQGAPGAGPRQAGFLAQGGGVQPRQIVNRGY